MLLYSKPPLKTGRQGAKGGSTWRAPPAWGTGPSRAASPSAGASPPSGGSARRPGSACGSPCSCSPCLGKGGMLILRRTTAALRLPGVWPRGTDELGTNSMSSWSVGRGPMPPARFATRMLVELLLEELDSPLRSPLPLLGFCTDWNDNVRKWGSRV